ncbi:OmpA family protein [Arundinibacter roseus]|uniref:Flagellar motor protein MotB n=1 Tax=Arundinibacter roseus TaxID=2070510 RepID=A0A4R4KEI4_9BACT|nr:OmpA family protein [Arundinibacter roseus]TDB65252.1 flagellar motor protein MotB [Arundinibacter roseus]
MKHVYILLLISILILPVSAQSILSQADNQYNSLAYLKASELYQKYLENKNLNENELLSGRAKLAYCYRQLKDTPNAENVFREMISSYGKDLPTEYSICYLYFAQALASNGKYKEAQDTYAKYSSIQEEDKRGVSFSKLYNNVGLLTKNSGSYKIEELTINSLAPDFSPMYYKEGLVFVSGRTEPLNIKRVFNWNDTPFLDLYFLSDLTKIKGKSASSLGGDIAPKSSVRKRKSVLGMDSYTALTSNDSRKVGFFTGSSYNTTMGYDERPLTDSEAFSKTLNSKYHEGPATFTRDGSRVIFTRNNYNNGEYKESQDGINKLKLYTSEIVNGSWGPSKELPFNSDDYSTGHPTLNFDNTLLYFASDRPGGFGGTDIYLSRFENGTWSEPVNLGPEVNTKGNEMFPFVDNNGNLYFSSDGRPGLGDLDIFFAAMEGPAKPKKSLNLGAPINSNKDDFGIITDTERTVGYFSSNRKNGGKDDDIFRFRREGPMYACRDLTILVYDEKTKMPLTNSLVQIENKNSSENIRQLRTDSSGNVMLCLAAENDFMLIASNEGFQNNTIGFSTSAFEDDRPTLLEIPLKKIEVEDELSADAGTEVKGVVLSQNTNAPVAGVKVFIKDETDGTVQEVLTGAAGEYTFKAIPGHNYSIDGELKDYGTFGKKIVGYTPEKDIDLSLLMFEKGAVINIENIYYDLDKWDIRPDAAFELNKVVDVMEKYPSMKIELGSHTDSRASARYNKTLSNNRAKSAKQYLVSKGISEKRIISKGYGESKLTNSCGDQADCTDEEHQKNRRTEIKVLNLK